MNMHGRATVPLPMFNRIGRTGRRLSSIAFFAQPDDWVKHTNVDAVLVSLDWVDWCAKKPLAQATTQYQMPWAELLQTAVACSDVCVSLPTEEPMLEHDAPFRILVWDLNGSRERAPVLCSECKPLPRCTLQCWLFK